MSDFTSLLQQGHAWFFIPSAILLGILHGLEPGHSKTMMAAFIVAIKGTVRQAVMLGLAATLSHTAVVWGIALGGMYISQKFTAERVEPWMQLFSALIILGTAIWIIWRTWSGEKHGQTGGHSHPHEHDETRVIDINNNASLALSIHEDSRGAYFRISPLSGARYPARMMTVQVTRDSGQQETYHFTDSGDDAQSSCAIPEPHEFTATLHLAAPGNTRAFETRFTEHVHHELDGLTEGSQEYQDAHARAHASEIQRRFSSGPVTDGQILLFGLTGGLIPCPAAITILLICIQLKAFTLGAALVICFSIGLALTLVTVGVGAAWSVHQAATRWRGFNALAKRAPYFSGTLIALVGIYMAIHAYTGLVR